MKRLDIIDYSAFIGKINRFYKNSDKEEYIPSIGKIFKKDVHGNEILDIISVKLVEHNNFIILEDW